MDSEATRGILRDIHTLYTLGTMGGRTDAELLERFLARGDSDAEDAFATLVARHGPMVLGVCRRMLPASHDAEDAFQATFLVLARRAASIVRRERVASWLYSVAVRTAQVARRRVARQRAAERRLMDETSEAKSEPAEDREDLLPILDEELNRLPHRYRVALVACELEGKPRREAARQLGIPEGTLSTHLARGRKLLRERLQRRGVSLGVGPIAGLAGPLVENAVPERLIGPTVRAALVDSSAAGATAIVTTAVSSLAERVLKMMFLARLSLVVAALTTAAAGMATAVALGWTPTAAESPKADSTRAGPVDKAGAAKDRYGDPLPEGTVARLGSIRFRGGDRPVNAMRFSPDGQTLLTVSQDFLLRLWETKTGRLLHQVLPGSGSASSQCRHRLLARRQADRPLRHGTRRRRQARVRSGPSRRGRGDREGSESAPCEGPRQRSRPGLHARREIPDLAGVQRRLSHRGDRLGRGTAASGIPPRRHRLAGPLAGRQARGDLDRCQHPEALPVGLARTATSRGR